LIGVNKLYTNRISSQEYLFKYPWEHYIFDDFLDDKTLKKALNFIKKKDYKFIINKDDKQKIQYSLNFDNKLNEIFVSKWFKTFLEKITCSNVEFFEENFVQLRRMDISSPVFSKHVDIIDEQKSFVIILYLTEGWQTINKGELLLYKTYRTSKKNSKIIDPILNRLVILPTGKNHWHSVEKVKNFTRYSIIQEWIKK